MGQKIKTTSEIGNHAGVYMVLYSTRTLVMTIVWVWPIEVRENKELHGVGVNRQIYPYMSKQQ
jgi:hypothetical protein